MRSSDPWVTRAAVAGMIGPVVFWVVVAVLGVLLPTYSHVTEFVSTLGAVGAPYAIVQRLNFVLLGGSIIAFSVGLHRWFDESRRPSVGTFLMILLGLGVVGAGVFQSDPATPDSTTNLIHDSMSGIGLLAGIGGVTLLSRRLDGEPRWPRRRFTTTGTVLAALGSALLFFVFIDSTWVGLAQRLFIGVLTGWVGYHAYRLYRLSA